MFKYIFTVIVPFKKWETIKITWKESVVITFPMNTSYSSLLPDTIAIKLENHIRKISNEVDLNINKFFYKKLKLSFFFGIQGS